MAKFKISSKTTSFITRVTKTATKFPGSFIIIECSKNEVIIKGTSEDIENITVELMPPDITNFFMTVTEV